MATFTGTAGNDTYAGTNEDDNILGLAGNDTLNGADGDDVIDGGEGADLITGGDGNDTIDGGDGGDDIQAEDGDDAITGSDGADVIDGGDGTDSFTVDGLIGYAGLEGTSWQLSGTSASATVREGTLGSSTPAETTYTPTDANDLTADAGHSFVDGAPAVSVTNALNATDAANIASNSVITGFEDGTEATVVTTHIAGNQDDLATAFNVTGEVATVVTTAPVIFTGDDRFDISINGITTPAFTLADYASVDGLVDAINNSNVGNDLVASNAGGVLQLTGNVQGQAITTTIVDPDSTPTIAFNTTVAAVPPSDNTLTVTYGTTSATYTIGEAAANGIAGSINTLDDLVAAINTDFGAGTASNESDELRLNGASENFSDDFTLGGTVPAFSAPTATGPIAEANTTFALTVDGATATVEIGTDTGEVATLTALITEVNSQLNTALGTTGVNYISQQAATPNVTLTVEGLDETLSGEISTAGSDANVAAGIFGDPLNVAATPGVDDGFSINGTSIGTIGSGFGEIETLTDLANAITNASITGVSASVSGGDLTITNTAGDLTFNGTEDLDIAGATGIIGMNVLSTNSSALTDVETLIGDNGTLDLSSTDEQYLVGRSLSVSTSPDGETLLDLGATNNILAYNGGAVSDDSGAGWEVVALDGETRTYGSSDTLTATLADGGSVSYDPATGALVYTPPAAAELLQNGESYDGGSVTFTIQDNTPIPSGGTANTWTETFTLEVVGDDTIELFEGGSNFVGGELGETIIADDDEDATVVGNGGADRFFGGEGNDTFWAGQDDDAGDTLNGGEGNDTMGGAAGDDDIAGDEGDDLIFGGEGEDILRGGDDDDIIWAGSDNDEVYGDAGDDILGGGDGEDYIEGGDGDDVIYGGADDSEDILLGGDGDDLIFGGGGDDALFGGDGDDIIFNGAGDDLVIGGDGEDALWGGEGDDQLDLGNDGFDDLVAFVSGNGNDAVTGFELVAGGPDGVIGDVVDLTAFDFADTQAVIDAMTDDGGNAVLALAPGQTVTFVGLSVADFQATADDWVLV